MPVAPGEMVTVLALVALLKIKTPSAVEELPMRVVPYTCSIEPAAGGLEELFEMATPCEKTCGENRISKRISMLLLI